jgi:hypothetical protein
MVTQLLQGEAKFPTQAFQLLLTELDIKRATSYLGIY